MSLLRKNKAAGYAVLSGPLIFVLALLVVPYLIMFSYSFYLKTYPTFQPDFQFGNYALLFTDPQYYQVFLRTFLIAVKVTLLSLLFAFPITYYLVFVIKSSRLRSLLYLALILPLWVSYLLRGYIWKIILGNDGILNSLLMYLGVIDEPSQVFLYNQTSMIVTFVYILIPFMAMPIYAVLEKIPRNLIEASEDLGYPAWQTFLQVTLPLSISGIVAGCTMTFCLTFGDFITPILVGGTDGTMVANVVTTQFGAALNWPLGAAISVAMLVVVLIVLNIGDRLEKRGMVKG
ncbi:ABC transporter permease [Roseovarius sp. 2305UL8-3]|uniref:ABC transporter permease n=1 Tax=Roseovarius conchicola TaxID=3121636 RepID=UPI00352976BE